MCFFRCETPSLNLVGTKEIFLMIKVDSELCGLFSATKMMFVERHIAVELLKSLQRWISHNLCKQKLFA